MIAYFSSLKVKNWHKCLVLLPAFLFASLSADAWPWSWNKVDKNELRHGKWRTYHDEEKETVLYKGRYKHGKESGRWKSYTPDGKLHFKERYKLKKNQVKTSYYHPNGKVSHRGIAYQYETKKGNWNFYWDGDWKFYDASGQYLGNMTYVKGTATTSQPVLPSNDKVKE